MRYSLFSFCFFIFIQINGQVNRHIGTNLTSIKDYSSEFVFVDAFKQGRSWISFDNTSGAAWNSGIEVPLGTNGYPIEIPYNDGVNPPQSVRTLLLWIPGVYPSGYYKLKVEGQGQVKLRFSAGGVYNTPIDTLVYVDNSQQGVDLEILQSNINDPISAINFVMPSFHNNYLTEVYHPDFIGFLKDFEMIRFMDWMRTNNSEIVDWTERNNVNNYTEASGNGVSYEHIFRLCNKIKKNPWICIPHKANDQYITNLAQLFKDSLDPSLKLHVEYSNEVWNGQFSQNNYSKVMGDSLGYSGPAWEKGWKFYAKRTADVHRIFENVFQDQSRLKKVISSQAANNPLVDRTINYYNNSLYNASQVEADVIATAPYFGGSVANNLGAAGLMNSCSVSDILDSMEVELQLAFQRMENNKLVASNQGLELMTYEGGQHLVASSIYSSNTAFVDKLIEANRNPRMEDLYCQYFNYWYDSLDLGHFCHFSSHSKPNKYGSWGVKEFLDDTLSPKYVGLQNCVFSYNTQETASIEQYENENKLTIYPNPSPGIVTISSKNNKISFVKVISIEGKIIRQRRLNLVHLTQENLPKGVYYIEVGFSDKSRVVKTVFIY